MSLKTKVLIVSENRLLRDTLAHIVEQEQDLAVVGSVRLCREATEVIAGSRPDVLLLNPSMPAMPDLDDIQRIRRRMPQLRVVTFGMEDNEEVFLTAVRTGVVGYVLKDAYSSDVVQAVRAAARGEAICPPRLCLCLFAHFAKEPNGSPKLRLRTQVPLTRREQELLPMIVQGLTNKEIAAQLNISQQTVKNHVHRILRKAGSNNRLAVQEQCRASELVA
ncbi:MAG: response regulator transcription factor [Candidatus Acidiferrales bacterium]